MCLGAPQVVPLYKGVYTAQTLTQSSWHVKVGASHLSPRYLRTEEKTHWKRLLLWKYQILSIQQKLLMISWSFVAKLIGQFNQMRRNCCFGDGNSGVNSSYPLFIAGL